MISAAACMTYHSDYWHPRLILTTYYWPLTTYYSLLSTHYSLLTLTPYSLLLTPTTYYSLLSTYYLPLRLLASEALTDHLLLATYYLLLTTHYFLLTTYHSDYWHPRLITDLHVQCSCRRLQEVVSSK